MPAIPPASPQSNPARQTADWFPPVPQAEGKGKGLAITSLFIGLAALLLAFVPVINNFAFVLALIGLVFGVVALIGARKRTRAGKGMALAGVILALLAVGGVFASQAFYASVLDEVTKSVDGMSG